MLLTLVLVAAFALLSWRDLRLALIVLCGLLPSYLLRLDYFFIPTTALELMILVSVAVWVTKHHGLKIDLRSLGADWVRPIFLLLAAACFAVVVSPDTFSALGIWKAYFVEPVIFFLMLRSTFREERDWRQALTALMVSALVVSFGAMVQRFTGLGIPAPWDIENRATSIFDFPNAVGLFLAPIVSFAAVIAIIGRDTTQVISVSLRRLALVAAIFGMLAIVFSQTEAAILAIPAGLLFTLLASETNKKNKLVALVVSIAVFVALFVTVPVVREKLLLQDASGLARQNLWRETSALLTDHPIFGAGLAGFPTRIADYHDYSYYEIFQYPHNIILNIWVELGLLGLLAAAWLSWTVIKTTRTTPYALAAFAALSTMVIHGLVDVPYFKNDLSMLTWFFLALLSANVIINKAPRS